MIYKAEETAVMYAVTNIDIRVYSPTARLATLDILSLSLQTVLERMKVIDATKSGITMIAAVKLKLSRNREKRNMPFGGIGVRVSLR